MSEERTGIRWFEDEIPDDYDAQAVNAELERRRLEREESERTEIESLRFRLQIAEDGWTRARLDTDRMTREIEGLKAAGVPAFAVVNNGEIGQVFRGAPDVDSAWKNAWLTYQETGDYGVYRTIEEYRRYHESIGVEIVTVRIVKGEN